MENFLWNHDARVTTMHYSVTKDAIEIPANQTEIGEHLQYRNEGRVLLDMGALKVLVHDALHRVQQAFNWVDSFKAPRWTIPRALPEYSSDRAIPHNLIFTFFGNWAKFIHAHDPNRLIDRVDNDQHVWDSLSDTEQAIISNTNELIKINKATSVHFYDDAECERALQPLNLVEQFRKVKDLRYKSDICRLGALYEEGGYYFDSDMVPVAPVTVYVKPETVFTTVIGGGYPETRFKNHSVVWAPNSRREPIKQFFQSFMAAEKGSPIIKRAAKIILDIKEGRRQGCDDLLGPCTLALAVKELHPEVFERLHTSPPRFEFQQEHLQFLQEAYLDPSPPKADMRIVYMKRPNNCDNVYCNYVVIDAITIKRRKSEVMFFSRLSP